MSLTLCKCSNRYSELLSHHGISDSAILVYRKADNNVQVTKKTSHLYEEIPHFIVQSLVDLCGGGAGELMVGA